MCTLDEKMYLSYIHLGGHEQQLFTVPRATCNLTYNMQEIYAMLLSQYQPKAELLMSCVHRVKQLSETVSLLIVHKWATHFNYWATHKFITMTKSIALNMYIKHTRISNMYVLTCYYIKFHLLVLPLGSWIGVHLVALIQCCFSQANKSLTHII